MKDTKFYKQVIQTQAKQIDVLTDIITEYKERYNESQEGMEALMKELQSLKTSHNKNPDTKKSCRHFDLHS